jgi:CheY-like chemotaxis protein
VKKPKYFQAVPLDPVLERAAAAEERAQERKGQAGRELPSSPEKAPRENGARNLNSKRVLVVDDEQCIADTLAAILQNSGYQATAVYDAQSAMEACRVHAPELVISDVVMPGTGGVELAIFLRKTYPDCRILLFSGQAATADILERARRQGYKFDLLAKPVHPKDLLARIAV